MCRLRCTKLEAATELLFADVQIQTEIALLPQDPNAETGEDRVELPSAEFQSAVLRTNYWIRIVQLFRNAGTRRATVAAAVVMVSRVSVEVRTANPFRRSISTSKLVHSAFSYHQETRRMNRC